MRKRKVIVWVICSAAGLSVLLFLLALAISPHGFDSFASMHRPQWIGKTVYHVKTGEKVVALTYDDGPNPPFTDSILNALDNAHAKATFFVLGQNTQKYPGPVRREIADGHEIGNHSWDHAKLFFRSPGFIRQEVVRTDSVIRALGYTGPIPFRAPFGMKLIVLPWILHRLNKLHVFWDITLYDWEDRDPRQIAKFVLDNVRPGAIILLHDGNETLGGDRRNTVTATRLILDELGRKGYRFLTITDMVKLSINNKPTGK
jgi:peptidoglycan/xylan/chitin deacetylase (PgdA/CDA1 family)